MCGCCCCCGGGGNWACNLYFLVVLTRAFANIITLPRQYHHHGSTNIPSVSFLRARSLPPLSLSDVLYHYFTPYFLTCSLILNAFEMVVYTLSQEAHIWCAKQWSERIHWLIVFIYIVTVTMCAIFRLNLCTFWMIAIFSVLIFGVFLFFLFVLFFAGTWCSDWNLSQPGGVCSH